MADAEKKPHAIVYDDYMKTDPSALEKTLRRNKVVNDDGWIYCGRNGYVTS